MHRGVAALLNAVLLATFVAVPLLDGISAEYGAVIESEHGRCNYVRIHDHAICVQFGANAARTAPIHAALPPTPPLQHVDQGSTAELMVLDSPRLLPRTRAPPRI